MMCHIVRREDEPKAEEPPVKEIGSAFGGRDHSTVIHSLEKVLELQEDPEYKRRLITLRDNLRQLPR